MKDGPVRRFVKALARWRYGADLAFTRAVQRRRGEEEYRLCGECNGCGACCETPTIATHRVLFHLKSVRWATLLWHRKVNGFELLETDRETHSYVFRCTHFDPVSRQCDSYESRPGMCRDYPRNLAYTYRPEFLPDCGYYALSLNAESIRESLQDLEELPPEKREALEREFYVWEPALRPILHLEDAVAHAEAAAAEAAEAAAQASAAQGAVRREGPGDAA